MSGRSAKKKRASSVTGPDWTQLDIRMFQDDCAWVHSTVSSAKTDGAWESAFGLVLLPHMARIVHEGAGLVARHRPAQAKSIQLRFRGEIEAARHAVKLLDDNKRTAEEIIADFDKINAEHADALAGSLDLAVVSTGGQLLTTSRVASFHYAARLAVLRASVGQRNYSYELAHDLGSAMATILKQFGRAVPPPLPIALPAGSPAEHEDGDRDDYLAGRFASGLTGSEKELLTTVEGTVNTALLAFEPAVDLFPGPVFRGRVVVLTHALTALEAILALPVFEDDPESGAAIANIIRSNEASNFLTYRTLRNRCMHYGIPSSIEVLDPSAPDYGLCAATTGRTFHEVNFEVTHLLTTISKELREWRPGTLVNRDDSGSQLVPTATLD